MVEEISFSVTFIEAIDGMYGGSLKIPLRVHMKRLVDEGLSLDTVFLDGYKDRWENLAPEGITGEDFRRWMWVQLIILGSNPNSDPELLAEQIKIDEEERPALVEYLAKRLQTRRDRLVGV